MENIELLSVLNEYYETTFTGIELLREGGNATYSAWAGEHKYFLKCVGQAFSDTVATSVDINLYLQNRGFAVPKVVLTANNAPFVVRDAHHIVLYEFLETSEIDMERDAEPVGALIGRLHSLMEDYSGKLAERDRHFYVDRYIEILKKKRYSKVDEFIAHGERLWSKVKALPRGYSHGDMYCGNIERGADGRLYVLDLDTSCIGFPLYDLALICNRTDYFNYDENGLPKTLAVYRRLIPEYQKQNDLAGCTEGSLCDLVALYHFALQATIIEIYGMDCVNNAFFDSQLAWLNRWERQTEGVG